MKKRLIGVFMLLLVPGLLVWAGGQQQKKEKAAPLTVWMKKGFVEQQNTEFDKRVKEFAAKKNIPLNIEFLAYEDIFPKWTAAIESKNVPDISFFGYQEVGQFSKQGVMEDVTSFVQSIESKYGKIFPNSVQAVSFGGKTYAIPFWGEGTALYYRKDLFAKAGIANPPDTWEEFRTYAIKTTDAAANVYGAGIGYGAGNSDAEWLSRSMIWSAGGAIFSADGKKIVFDSPETKAAVEFVAGLFLKDKVTPPTAIGWNDAGNNTSYLSGQSAMIVNTGSVVKALEKNNPDLLKKTGVVVLPKGPAGRFTAGISNNLGIFKDAKQKDLAKELLTYLMDPAWYKEWIAVSAPLALPVYEQLAKSEAIWQQEYNKAFMDSMGTFKFLGYKGDYSPEAGKIYNLRIMNALFENVISKGMSVDAAVDQFVKEAEKVMPK